MLWSLVMILGSSLVNCFGSAGGNLQNMFTIATFVTFRRQETGHSYVKLSV